MTQKQDMFGGGLEGLDIPNSKRFPESPFKFESETVIRSHIIIKIGILRGDPSDKLPPTYFQVFSPSP